MNKIPMPQIVGVDFDDTLFLNSFPFNDSEPNTPVINFVKYLKRYGWYVILVTCRTKPEHVEFAVNACKSVGLELDAVNENHPRMIEEFGDCRKIFCDLYIDDRNITMDDVEWFGAWSGAWSD